MELNQANKTIENHVAYIFEFEIWRSGAGKGFRREMEGFIFYWLHFNGYFFAASILFHSTYNSRRNTQIQCNQIQ